MSGYERHHWVNTLVGVLDAGFSLTEEEQFFCAAAFTRLLDQLGIPDRGDPQQVPAALAMERDGSVYSTHMAAARHGAQPLPRTAGGGDLVVPLEDWRDALAGMLWRAYPDMHPAERLTTVAVIDDLLAALGVPGRAARHLPNDVITAHRATRN